MKKKNFMPAWLYIWLMALFCELLPVFELQAVSIILEEMEG